MKEMRPGIGSRHFILPQNQLDTHHLPGPSSALAREGFDLLKPHHFLPIELVSLKEIKDLGLCAGAAGGESSLCFEKNGRASWKRDESLMNGRLTATELYRGAGLCARCGIREWIAPRWWPGRWLSGGARVSQVDGGSCAETRHVDERTRLSIGDGENPRVWFTRIQRASPSVRRNAMLRSARNLVQTRDLARCEQLVAVWANSREDVSSDLHVALLTLYWDAGKLVQARQLFERLLDSKQACAQTFSKMMFILMKNGSYQECEAVFEKLLRSGLETNTTVCNTMLWVYVRKGDVSKAEKLFHRMEAGDLAPPSVHSLNAIMTVCSRARMVDKMLIYLGRLLEMADIDASMYCSMMRALCMNNRMDDAEKLMTHIEKHSAGPPDRCYLSLIHGHSKNGKASLVARTFERARSAGIPMTTSFYNSLYHAYLKLGERGRAEELWKRESFVKNMQSYSLRLDNLLHANDMSAVRATLAEMRDARVGSAKETLPYHVLAMAKEGYLDVAQGMLERMKKANVRPTAKLLTSMVMEAAIRGDGTLVYNLVREMRALGYEPLVGTFEALIRFYGEAGDERKFRAVYEELKDYGYQPSAAVVTRLIQVLGKRGSVQFAGEFLAEWLREGGKPDAKIISALVYMYSQTHNASGLSRTMALAAEHGVGIDHLSLRVLIDYFGRMGDSESVERLLASGFASNETPPARLTFLRGYAKLAESAQTPELREKYDHKSKELASSLLENLESLSDPEVAGLMHALPSRAAEIYQKLSRPVSSSSKIQLIRSLCRLKDPGALVQVRTLLVEMVQNGVSLPAETYSLIMATAVKREGVGSPLGNSVFNTLVDGRVEPFRSFVRERHDWISVCIYRFASKHLLQLSINYVGRTFAESSPRKGLRIAMRTGNDMGKALTKRTLVEMGFNPEGFRNQAGALCFVTKREVERWREQWLAANPAQAPRHLLTLSVTGDEQEQVDEAMCDTKQKV